MNRTAFFRRFSLALASLSIATAAFAADDAALSAARDMAATDAQIASQLQTWLDDRDIALVAQADGLITNDMRAAAAEYAIAQMVEADGLISAQLREQVEHTVVARLAAADGLVVDSPEFAWSQPESSPATRNPGAVLVAAGGR